jgi:heptosyltransferase II
MTKLSPEQIRRVVVRGTNWVGDAMMTVPALRELRQLFPEAHITLATRSWAKGLFDGADFLNDILVSDQRGALSVFQQARQWSRGNFDLAVIFPNSFASALVAALARVPIRAGYDTESRRMLLTLPVPLPEWRSSRHEVFYYLNIVKALERDLLGTDFERAPNPSLTISSERKEHGKRLLADAGALGDALIVALCPGSINSRAKRWPAERFAELGDRLIADAGASVVLIGSNAELEISQNVASLMKHKPAMLTGKTNLAELVDVLSAIDLLITNDTGPAHIAAALDRKTIVIFGPTNPLTTRPFGESAEMIRVPPDCAPCMLRDCPIDHRCMTAITPEHVFEEARMKLGTGLTGFARLIG